MSAKPPFEQEDERSLSNIINKLKAPDPDYSSSTLYKPGSPFYIALYGKDKSIDERVNAVCELIEEENKNLGTKIKRVFDNQGGKKAEFLNYLIGKLKSNQSIDEANKLVNTFQRIKGALEGALKNPSAKPEHLNEMIKNLPEEQLKNFLTNKELSDSMNKFIKRKNIPEDVREKLALCGVKDPNYSPASPTVQKQESIHFKTLKGYYAQQYTMDFRPEDIKSWFIDQDPTKILQDKAEREALITAVKLVGNKPNLLPALTALDAYHKSSKDDPNYEQLKGSLNQIFESAQQAELKKKQQTPSQDPQGANGKPMLHQMEHARLTANASLPTKLSSAATPDQQNLSLLELKKLLEEASADKKAEWKIPDPKSGADSLQIFKDGQPFGTAKMNGNGVQYEFNKAMDVNDARTVLAVSEHVKISSLSVPDIYNLTKAAAVDFKPPKSVTLDEPTKQFIEANKNNEKYKDMIAEIQKNMAVIEKAHPTPPQQKSEKPKLGP